MEAASWSEGEDNPMHAMKTCGEAKEFRHSLLTLPKGGASCRSALRPGRLSPHEEAPAYLFDMKQRGLQKQS
jgi:hypothetical protein